MGILHICGTYPQFFNICYRFSGNNRDKIFIIRLEGFFIDFPSPR